jgi:hypothetical protein
MKLELPTCCTDVPRSACRRALPGERVDHSLTVCVGPLPKALQRTCEASWNYCLSYAGAGVEHSQKPPLGNTARNVPKLHSARWAVARQLSGVAHPRLRRMNSWRRIFSWSGLAQLGNGFGANGGGSGRTFAHAVEQVQHVGTVVSGNAVFRPYRKSAWHGVHSVVLLPCSRRPARNALGHIDG